jgi:tRNA pseudouridine55 synthase
VHAGYLLVHKPAGPTSHDAVDAVRRIAQMRQVGHAGTLDPFAEGLLIILVGAYTKQSSAFMKLPKEYTATLTLGASSNTDDREGTITAKEDAPRPDAPHIERVLEKFRGKISQIPPQFSAIKIGGKKAYREARAGRTLELAPRGVEIFKLDVLSYNFPSLRIFVASSSGTYIRALARDIGEALGTGALLSALRRDAVGPYRLEDAVPLNTLTPENIEDYIKK